jgi:rhodanese-related sulfurtransferase
VWEGLGDEGSRPAPNRTTSCCAPSVNIDLFYQICHDLSVPETESVPAVDQALAAARYRIRPRVASAELEGAIAAGALVVDIRPAEYRQHEGAVPGAIVVERNVLEWRLDPSSPYRLSEMDDPARRIILFCNEGYASSLAAAALRDLGLTDITDLEGGFRAWRSRLSRPT